MTSETFFEKLSDALLQPPAHAWDGPQPGLSAQADERCRYYFSQNTGRLERIVQHDATGAPAVQVHYRHVDSGEISGQSRARAFEIERWNGDAFVSEGVVAQDGRVIRTHALPRTMLTEHGKQEPIPRESDIFITPSGEVVRLSSQGTFFASPRAAYLGRATIFNAAHPFVVKTPSGEHELSVDCRDTVIDVEGNVFEFKSEGLVAIGELVIPELDHAADQVGTQHLVHDFFTLSLADNAVTVDFHDAKINEMLERPLHPIGGRHPFVHDATPELVDIHGSTLGEERLREVERAALELGLVSFALRNETRRPARAAFLKAQHALEDRLWHRIDRLEELVGMARHTLVNPTQIRAWIDRAAEHPHEALLALKAHQSYVAAR